MLAELISTCLVLVGVYPTLIKLINESFGPWTAVLGFDLTYPLLWGVFAELVEQAALLNGVKVDGGQGGDTGHCRRRE